MFVDPPANRHHGAVRGHCTRGLYADGGISAIECASGLTGRGSAIGMRSRARVRSGNGRRARVGRLSRLLGLYAMLTASAWAMSARAQSTTAAGTPIRFISALDLSAYYPAASRRIGEQGRAVVR